MTATNFDLDNMYCGAVKRGDILRCRIESKTKIAAVLQDDILNQSMPSIVCAEISPTANNEELFPNEVKLTSKETGLGKNSVCRLYKLYTVNRESVFAKKGELSQKKLTEIFKALDINLGRFRD